MSGGWQIVTRHECGAPSKRGDELEGINEKELRWKCWDCGSVYALVGPQLYVLYDRRSDLDEWEDVQ